MGGSGSGGWSPMASSDKCAGLAFEAQINSPQAALLSTLVNGEHLAVELSALPKQIVQVVKNNAVVGVLTGPQTAQLINCLQNGYRYKAVVLSVTGGMCTVKVQPS